MKTLLSMTALGIGLCAPAIVLAQPSDIQFATPKRDTSNYLGDFIDRKEVMWVNRVKLGDSKAIETVCVPGGISLKGIGKATMTIKDNAGKDQQADRTLFRVDGPTWTQQGAAACADKNAKGETVIKVAVGDTVAIDPQELRNSPPNRYGWAYGALAVPYKYQLRGDRGLVGSASLGGYVGYRVTWGGTEVQYVMFAGATKVDVSATKDGKTTVESRAGLSSGLGIVTTLKDEFQVGLIVGFDHVGKTSGYQYNGKPWISVSLGYDFVR